MMRWLSSNTSVLTCEQLPDQICDPHMSHDALQHPSAISHATSLSTGSHHPSLVCMCCSARMCLCIYGKSNSISAFEGMIQLRGSRSGGWRRWGVCVHASRLFMGERHPEDTFVLMMFWGVGMSPWQWWPSSDVRCFTSPAREQCDHTVKCFLVHEESTCSDEVRSSRSFSLIVSVFWVHLQTWRPNLQLAHEREEGNH